MGPSWEGPQYKNAVRRFTETNYWTKTSLFFDVFVS